MNHREFTEKYILPMGMSWMITKDISKKLKKIIGRKTHLTPKQQNYIKGQIGEAFIKASFRKSLYKLGYKEQSKSATGTFKLQGKYRTYVDIYLRITDFDGDTHRYYIEVKNWAKNTFPNVVKFRFERKIKPRFTKRDKDHRDIWVLCMNRRNVEAYKPYCDKEGIYIIPLREHYTGAFIKRIINENRLIQEIDNNTIV